MGARFLRCRTRAVAAPALVAALVMLPGGRAAAAACPESSPAKLDFTLTSLTGDEVALEDFAGKVILLDFWATWCAPCKVEIPWFIDFYERYQAQGLQVVGVAVDDTAEVLQRYADQIGMNYPVLLGLGRDDVTEAYQPMPGLPTTFIIDREGSICMRHTGLGDREMFEAQIEELL